jgi:poly(3-hydroxybutyrate) depolymerase
VAAFLLAAACWPLPAEAKLAVGQGRFEVQHGGKTILVWYFLPKDASSDTPVLFVMHGVNRDADRYRDEWVPQAEEYGFLLLVPEFSEKGFPGVESYNFGNTFDEQKRLKPRAQWTFGFLEPIFDFAKAATGNRSERYYLYGHSAGAQFVHRFLYFMPEAKVAKVVAANAGWWTLPDLEVDLPYGLRGAGLDTVALKAMLQRPLIVLLGTADTDPQDPNLRRTPEALAQGPHRFARGHFFYDAGKHRAESLDVPFGWQLETAPGVGHSDKGMAPYAARLLFGPAEQSRP